jgi:alanine racemase
MSFTTVDVSLLDGVCPGDEAALLGEQIGEFLGADEIAERTGTIPNEILCAFGPATPSITPEPEQ